MWVDPVREDHRDSVSASRNLTPKTEDVSMCKDVEDMLTIGCSSTVHVCVFFMASPT